MKWNLFIFALLMALPFCHPAAAGEEEDVCKALTLPSSIGQRLKNDFAGFDIQSPMDLNAEASERWEIEKPLKCPGMVTGHFIKADSLSYAFLMVSPITGRFRLVLFISEKSAPIIINRTDNDVDVSRYFLRGMALTRLLGKPSLQKLQPQAPDGIVLVNAGKDMDQSDVYFPTPRGFRFAPVEY